MGRAYTHKAGQSDASSVDAKEVPGGGEERGGQQCDRERNMASGLTPSLHLSLPSRRPTSSKQTKAHSPEALRADPEQERDDCREEDEIGGERLAKLLALEVHGVSPRALPPCFSRSAPCTCTTWPCPRLDDDLRRRSSANEVTEFISIRFAGETSSLSFFCFFFWWGQ